MESKLETQVDRKKGPKKKDKRRKPNNEITNHTCNNMLQETCKHMEIFLGEFSFGIMAACT